MLIKYVSLLIYISIVSLVIIALNIIYELMLIWNTDSKFYIETIVYYFFTIHFYKQIVWNNSIFVAKV